jgi:hypothetical protein
MHAANGKSLGGRPRTLPCALFLALALACAGPGGGSSASASQGPVHGIQAVAGSLPAAKLVDGDILASRFDLPEKIVYYKSLSHNLATSNL